MLFWLQLRQPHLPQASSSQMLVNHSVNIFDSSVFPPLTSFFPSFFSPIQLQWWRAPSTCWQLTPPPPPPCPQNDRTGTSWAPNSRTPSASKRRMRRPRPPQPLRPPWLTRTRLQLTTQAATATSLCNHTPQDPPLPPRPSPPPVLPPQFLSLVLVVCFVSLPSTTDSRGAKRRGFFSFSLWIFCSRASKGKKSPPL